MFDLLCIVGPTASGKTNLAVRLAAAFGGEIISADSRQVYRGMDIGLSLIHIFSRAVSSILSTKFILRFYYAMQT